MIAESDGERTLKIGQICQSSAATNLEVHMGNRDHLNYCTFVLQAVNDAQARMECPVF